MHTAKQGSRVRPVSLLLVKGCSSSSVHGPPMLKPKILLTPRHSLNALSEPRPSRTLDVVEASKCWLPILLVVLCANWYLAYRPLRRQAGCSLASYSLGLHYPWAFLVDECRLVYLSCSFKHELSLGKVQWTQTRNAANNLKKKRVTRM